MIKLKYSVSSKKNIVKSPKVNYKSHGKRIFDLILSIVISLLILPVFLGVFILLVFLHKGNPFFLQARPGKGGEIFRIIKFKTMIDLCDQYGHPLPDHLRILGVGTWLRKFSLDEIPQLINVIRGEMSLIGPRPLLVDYWNLYSERELKRHDVLPGITGWAQIHGRNTISWKEKFEYDLWYVEHCSFGLDLKILLLTAWKVFVGKGVNEPNQVTVSRFDEKK